MITLSADHDRSNAATSVESFLATRRSERVDSNCVSL